MIIVSFPVLWNNERKKVRIESVIITGGKRCEEVNINEATEATNYKLVYGSGETSVQDLIQDGELQVDVQNALRLIRKVEMYQWVEHKQTHKNNHGAETIQYSYTAEWREDVLDSRMYYKVEEHENPGMMPYNSEVFNVQRVQFGAYQLA